MSINFTTNGKDYNFFQKVSVTSTTFGVVDGYTPDVFITFPTQSIMMLNEGTGVVEFSFNGGNLHGELDSTKASAGLTFDNRVVSKIFLRIKSGSSGPIVVSLYAWGTR